MRCKDAGRPDSCTIGPTEDAAACRRARPGDTIAHCVRASQGIEESPDPLGLDREEMRALGYRTVDALVDWLTDDALPPLRCATPEEMQARLSGPAPAEGEPFEQVLDGLFRDVLPYTSRGAHPGFFAYVPFSGTWPGALGDFVASAANVYAGSWQEAAGPTQLELEVLGWFKEWVGYPADAGGTLVSGGSAANLTALACAREALVGSMRDDLVVYASDQAHSSIARAARMLGFRPDQMRVLPVGEDLRLEPKTLAAAMAADEAAGRRPFLAVANGGATSTGAVDPVAELAALCRERNVWLHCDAAYGGFAVLTERGRSALGELALADSIALDPHKWLYQPYECGCVLVRDPHALRRAFEITSDYLRDSEVDEGIVNFADQGFQLTRTSRAFKLWLSLRTFGVDAFRAAIDRSLDLAERRSTRDRGERAARARRAACARRRLLPPQRPRRRGDRRARRPRSRRAGSGSSRRRASTAVRRSASAFSATRRGPSTSMRCCGSSRRRSRAPGP